MAAPKSKLAEEKLAEEKKVSVILKCKYGKYIPNEKVSLTKDEAERLLSLDVAQKA